MQASAIALPVLGMMFWDPFWSRSILLGGMAVLVPNAFFAWASTRRKPGGWLLVQGVVKFLLSVLLMVIAFRNFSPHPESFFTGVIAALLAHAIGGFWLQGSAALQAPPDRRRPGEQ